MRKYRKYLQFLLAFLISLFLFFTLFFSRSPQESIHILFFDISPITLFFILFFTTIYTGISFFFKNKTQGFLVALLLEGIILLRFLHVFTAIFIGLLFLLFVALELFFWSKK